MAEFSICDRRVIIVSADNSQTVNICTTTGREGVYDWTIRLSSDVPILDEARSVGAISIEGFVGWLKQTLRGTIERVPPNFDPLLGQNRHEGADPESPFGERIMAVANRKIDELVVEFLEHPYLHRSEYNLHCELYERLCQKVEPKVHRIGSGDRDHVRLVHKEWPESHWDSRLGDFDVNTVWPPAEGGIGPRRYKKRGLYDVAVLSPNAVEACTDIKAYLEGRFQPVAAFEFGLLEKYDHFRSDIAKLINNRIRYGTVIHFVRPGETDNYDALESLAAAACNRSHIHTAYARVARNKDGVRFHYKLTGSPSVVESDVLPRLSG